MSVRRISASRRLSKYESETLTDWASWKEEKHVSEFRTTWKPHGQNIFIRKFETRVCTRGESIPYLNVYETDVRIGVEICELNRALVKRVRPEKSKLLKFYGTWLKLYHVGKKSTFFLHLKKNLTFVS